MFPVRALMPVLTCVCLAATPAVSSAPIQRSITGCVIEGIFVTSTGYELTQRRRNGSMLDLTVFEGRALTLEGWLHPGDAYDITVAPRDDGPCPDAIRQHAVKVLPWAFFKRSRNLYEAGDVNGALTAIDRALAIDPNLCAYGWRATVREAAGQTDDAILDATRASEQSECREVDREAARILLNRLKRGNPQQLR